MTEQLTTTPRSLAYGVTVMRCQAKKVTEGWKHLINTMAKDHDVIVIFLGYTGGMPNEDDPLTFDMRAAMLRDTFSHLNLIVEAIPDHPLDDDLWSIMLDEAIDDIVPAKRGVMLYDGRDGFWDYYTGKYRDQHVRVNEILNCSGTESRLNSNFPHSEDGREALIAYHKKRPGFGYSAVDNAIYDPETDEFILTAKRVFGDLRAFCGGHWDKTDASMEDTADRERAEEVVGITTTPARQLWTMPVADPRYRRSKKDGSITTICVSRYVSGEPAPADDVEIVERVKRADLIERLVPWHRPLGQYLLDHWPRVCELLEIEVRDPLR